MQQTIQAKAFANELRKNASRTRSGIEIVVPGPTLVP